MLLTPGLDFAFLVNDVFGRGFWILKVTDLLDLVDWTASQENIVALVSCLNAGVVYLCLSWCLKSADERFYTGVILAGITIHRIDTGTIGRLLKNALIVFVSDKDIVFDLFVPEIVLGKVHLFFIYLTEKYFIRQT